VGLALQREEVLEKIQQSKPYLQERFGVATIGLFGSFSRDEQTENSDVDLIVTFDKPIGLDFITLKDYLESLFQRKVDLVTMRALKPQLKDQILKDVIFQ